MALKQLMITRKISEARAALEAAMEQHKELETRRTALVTREAELEQAVSETDETISEEDKAALEHMVQEFEADQETLTGEEEENHKKREQLEQKIREWEAELEALNSRSKPIAIPEKREEKVYMENRKFFGMSMQERDAFMARTDVKDFLARVRQLGMEKRAVTGAELLIPTVMLDVLRDQIGEYSRLMNRVNLRRVPGKARQTIIGQIPEAVWTEMCATLNELSISFSQIDVDGYKVGGYIFVCNALLEDSDISLASEIMSQLAQAVGMALDKAILFGTGTKMPMGIATRLAQTAKPSGYPSTAPTWTDLHTSNVITITGKTGVALFQELAKAGAKAKSRYATGNRIWIMNEATRLSLMVEALSFNSSGAIVSGVNASMPAIGGEIIIVSDRVIANNTIICGYGDLYLLAERAGMSLMSSEHARFIEDQTGFRATARYDGRPVMAEGFVAIGLGAAPQTTATFASDTANTVAGGSGNDGGGDNA